VTALDSISLQIATNVLALKTIQSVEMRRRQAQKMEELGRLAAMVAHDFNNQLTVISLFSDSLITRLSRNPELLKAIQEIKKATKEAASLTRQLLVFGRQQVLCPRLLDLNKEVNGTVTMLERLLGARIKLETHLASDQTMVNADPVQIQQVITNLAVNARDAMPEGGRLTIETTLVEVTQEAGTEYGDLPQGRYVELSMKDSGLGMDSETLAHIFEPFFTTKVIGRGTGLGLSTVYGIVRQSGGQIRVESEPGSGTTFHVFLPRAAVLAGQDGSP
jgi:two-component system cell cycle sensor histidine kinase/response regulator CckA